MAVIKKRYKDINDTLKYIRLQIEESIPYADKKCPTFSSPSNLFFWLKPRLTYKKDPNKIELLQSMPTLMENNYHGTPGAGDCDCFSIAMASCCISQGWKTFIILAGRNKFTPVHIWTGVTIDGKDYNLDLTNSIPFKTRDYPYQQKIYIKPLINK